MRIIGFILLICCSCAHGAKRSPYIDPEKEKLDLAMRKDIAECKKGVKSIPKKLACSSDIYDEYHEKHLYRATEDYCEETYQHLSFQELENKYRELDLIAQTARKTRSSSKALPGELFSNEIAYEMVWINNKLAAMQHAAFEAEKKRLSTFQKN